MPLLLCDLDDTVLDRAGVFARWAEGFATAWGLPEDGLAWLIENDRSGYRPRPEFFALVRTRFRLAASVDDLVEAFYRRFSGMFTCDDEVRQALVGARNAGWRIAIVTNGSPSQEAKILAAGLDDLVDAWCISEVEGSRKPERRLLEIAARRCQESLTGAWLIGDAPDADIGAARASGLPSVWLRHGRAWPRDDYAPTLEAESFPEAVGMVLARGPADPDVLHSRS